MYGSLPVKVNYVRYQGERRSSRPFRPWGGNPPPAAAGPTGGKGGGTTPMNAAAASKIRQDIFDL